MADFVIREWKLAPYPGDQAPPHLHHRSDEAFYVLDGELEVLVGEQRRTFRAGELAFIPAGTVHTFASRGPADVRVLVVMTPEIDDLITALHSGASGQAEADIWASHNSALVPAV